MQSHKILFSVLIRDCFKILICPELVINIQWSLLSLRNLEFSMGMACTSNQGISGIWSEFNSHVLKQLIYSGIQAEANHPQSAHTNDTSKKMCHLMSLNQTSVKSMYNICKQLSLTLIGLLWIYHWCNRLRSVPLYCINYALLLQSNYLPDCLLTITKVSACPILIFLVIHTH